MSTPATTAPTTSAANPAANTSHGQAANPQAAPTINQPAPTPPRMMKVKIDGKEMDLPESEVLSGYQQGKVATDRFQEAAAMKKQADEIMKFAKENPKEFFAKTGMNARQWAEEYLIQELQNEAMSPEQKKARENEEKLRKYETEERSQAEKTRKEKEQ